MSDRAPPPPPSFELNITNIIRTNGSRSWLAKALERAAGAHVAVFGDFALDAYWDLDSDDSERSVETGKPVRKVRQQRYGLGGAGNVAANLTGLEIAGVHAIGLVGTDLFGDHLRAALDALDIDTSGLLPGADDWQTPVFAKPHRGGVEQSRLDFGAYNELTPSGFARLRDELERAARDCDVVILNQQIPAGLSPSPVIAWLNQLIRRSPPGRFLVDSRDRPHEYDGATLKINEAEARRMQGDPNGPIEALVTNVHERVGAPVFLTRGAHGIVAADATGVAIVPGIPIGTSIDPVGAGDTAVAAIAAARAGGADVVTAARLANLAAAITVTKQRTTGTASPDEIRALATRADPEPRGDIVSKTGSDIASDTE